MVEDIRIWVRNYFAAQHLWAARRFAIKASSIEDGYGDRVVFDIEHRAYVVSAITSAVAFMEAAINEVFQDAADADRSYLAPLPDSLISTLAELWKLAGERWAILDKYQVALLVAGKGQFDRGSTPYQDAELLRKLRNLLAHAKPETSETGSEHKLEKQFKGKFLPNRLMKGQRNPYFPDHCLGSGCAEWAVKSSVLLADEFFAKMGLVPHYQKVNYPEAGML
jgi:hypothetical protein